MQIRFDRGRKKKDASLKFNRSQDRKQPAQRGAADRGQYRQAEVKNVPEIYRAIAGHAI
jgi:hypothetical protein